MDVIFWNSDPSDRNGITRYIGPYKLAHWIRKYNYSAQVIDFIVHLSEEQLYNATKKFITQETMVLGISTTFISIKKYQHQDGSTWNFPEHLVKVIKRIKSEYPKLKVVVGGYASDTLYMGGIPHATIMSYTTAVEDIFLEYLGHYRNGSLLPLGKLSTSYYGLEGRKNLKTRMIYDQARNPKYNIETDDFRWTSHDVILENEPLPLDISRGCIFACRFCQFPHIGKGKLDYIRGMEYIKEELLDNYRQFGTTNYMILDDTFNDTEIKLRAFNDMISTLPFKIVYSAYIRADLIDRFPDTAYMLKESGLVGAINGIESLHPYSSKLIGKAWSGTRAREYMPKLYHDIWKGTIAQQINLIVGLPKETKEDIWDTIRWHSDNNLYSLIFNSLGLVNTSKQRKYIIRSEFERNSEKYGFTFDDDDQWRNETWTEQESIAATNKFKKYVYQNGQLRSSAWDLMSLLSMGYDREYLLKTSLKDMDRTLRIELKTARYTEYYDRLMAQG